MVNYALTMEIIKFIGMNAFDIKQSQRKVRRKKESAFKLLVSSIELQKEHEASYSEKTFMDLQQI